MTLIDLWGYIRYGGMVALLFLIIVGGWKRYWVFGWYADELHDRIRALEAKLDRAERAAVGGTALARRSLSVAERSLADPSTPREDGDG